MTRKLHRVPAPATRGILIRWASWYDVANRLLFLGRERRFRKWTADFAAVTRGDSVLDIGCGTGNLTMAVKARAGTEGEVHGIDAAPEMIREAERKAAEERLDIRYRVGLIEDIPFPDGQFDVVVSSLMLHHLPGDLKREGIAEIARVLRPGGRFVAVDLDLPLMRNLRTVREAMRANGFTGVRQGRTMFGTMLLRIYCLTGTAGWE